MKELDLIIAERGAQDVKWGQQNHDDYIWLAILMEEVGEAAQAILQEQGVERVRGELVQSAAVIVAWLEATDRRPLAVHHVLKP